jgi:hypothetical protein
MISSLVVNRAFVHGRLPNGWLLFSRWSPRAPGVITTAPSVSFTDATGAATEAAKAAKAAEAAEAASKPLKCLFKFRLIQSTVIIRVGTVGHLPHPTGDLVARQLAVFVRVIPFQDPCCHCGTIARSALTATKASAAAETGATTEAAAGAAEATSARTTLTAKRWWSAGETTAGAEIRAKLFARQLAVIILVERLEGGGGIFDLFRRNHAVVVCVEGF